jgi:anthranilate phosphoribosyltransferase
MDIHEAISALTRRIDLTRAQAVIVQRILMTGEATPSQIAAFLTALHMKGETVEEITGFAMTMRELATPILATRRPLVDTCGTGGDHAGTFNISTAAAFVVAGAGIAVAKHGNRSATSKCGSADVLEALGININATPEVVARCIDETGIGFLFARALHGAMKHVGPIRAELKFRTIFNILGPLTNPAGADGQVMGVFSTALVEPITQVLQHLGARHAFVVAGCDGLDELTLTGPSQVGETRDGEVRLYEITPEQVGLARAEITALRGGDAEENAAILRAVLDGETGPRRDIVLLNAAPAIVAGGAAETLEAGVAVAAKSIDSGAARARLETLIEASHAAG